MPAIPTSYSGAQLATVAALFLAAFPVLAGDRAAVENGMTYADPLDRPQLVRGYRSPLGLKSPQSGSRPQQQASTSAQVLARVALEQTVAEPLTYSIARAPAVLGLRGAEQAAGIVLRGSDRWASSFELSSAEDAVTAGRRTAVQGHVHAPLTDSIGLSVGIRLSGLQAPSSVAGADTPYANGYVMQSGRADVYAQQLGYQLQLNYLYGERNTVALSYVSRREADQFRLGADPSLLEGSLLSVTGEHWFSPSWALRYDIPTPESSSLIRRQGLRLGLHYRF